MQIPILYHSTSCINLSEDLFPAICQYYKALSCLPFIIPIDHKELCVIFIATRMFFYVFLFVLLRRWKVEVSEQMNWKSNEHVQLRNWTFIVVGCLKLYLNNASLYKCGLELTFEKKRNSSRKLKVCRIHASVHIFWNWNKY